MLITNQNDLEGLCQKLTNASSIALDTEFVRKNTYYAKLSIVQIGTMEGESYIIDATTVDMAIFNEKILQNPKIVKIIHAPQQDFEIFFYLFKEIPVNVFDSQTAAKFSGFRAHISYADLCKSICTVEIDKTYQAYNWLERPIPKEMLEYARCDVKYLHKIYFKLRDSIKDIGMFRSEMDKILNLENYSTKSSNAWKKVKIRTNFLKNPYILKTLAAFREELAAQLDIPRNFLLSDESLVYICKTLPTSKNELKIPEQKTKWIMLPKYQQKLFDLCAGLREDKENLEI
ncbi:MAG: ribonuclease D [Rickettsiaceae bacterium]|nr:ribonuclease D [Rickettsiaceae bacterium]